MIGGIPRLTAQVLTSDERDFCLDVDQLKEHVRACDGSGQASCCCLSPSLKALVVSDGPSWVPPCASQLRTNGQQGHDAIQQHEAWPQHIPSQRYPGVRGRIAPAPFSHQQTCSAMAVTLWAIQHNYESWIALGRWVRCPGLGTGRCG